MDLEAKMSNFRNANTKNYPELKAYSDKEIYNDFIGCGGLYLVTNMVRKMNLKKGDIVLDLGCGLGSSSIFLAKTFDVTVIAVDFWFSPSKLIEKIHREGLSHQIIPLNLDITRSIPFARQYFDAIFCMNSLFLYGENIVFIKNLLNTLKPGGVFCIGSESFNVEPPFQNGQDVPGEFNFPWNWNVWDGCFSKYHSPKWWHVLLSQAGDLDINFCCELEDGVILYEDLARHYYQYFNEEILAMGSMIPQERIVDQIIFGRENQITPTLFVLSGIKKQGQ